MGIFNAVKSFIGFETEEDYDDFDEQVQSEEEAPKKSFRFSRRHSDEESGYSGDETVNLGQIKIIKPNGFNDSERVAAEVRARRTVIFNVVELDGDEARRIVDFVAGTVYGVRGNISRVVDRVFVATPPNVNVSTDDIKAQARSSFGWNNMG